MKLPKLSGLHLDRLARRAVLAVADEALPGRAKRKAAAKLLATQIDNAIPLPGVLELLDGPVIEAFVGAIIENAYQELKDEGALDGRTVSAPRT